VPKLDPGYDSTSAVSIGRVVAAHGLRGEVKVEPLTDFPERFERGSRLWLAGTERAVQSSRWRGRHVYLKLEGVETRDAAEALRGGELRAAPRPLAGADRYYLHDIIGLRVEDAKGEALGKVADVLSTGANDVYVVRSERGELLLPAIEDVVREIDVAGGRIVVEVLPGLEFQAPPQRRAKPSSA
jgi:16S rRNA processing protein RimM